MLGYCQSTASATVAEMAWVQARTAPYFLFVMADTDRPSTAGCLQTIQIIHAGLRSPASAKAHAWTLAIQLMISTWCLVYSCVAMVAACSGSPPQCFTFSSRSGDTTNTNFKRVNELCQARPGWISKKRTPPLIAGLPNGTQYGCYKKKKATLNVNVWTFNFQ